MFGERLREERNRLGLSQEFFGEAAGVRKLSQIKYEKSERYPDLKYLMNILDMGCDVLYIMTGKKFPQATNDQEAMLLMLYRQADQPIQSATMRVLGAEFPDNNQEQ